MRITIKIFVLAFGFCLLTTAVSAQSYEPLNSESWVSEYGGKYRYLGETAYAADGSYVTTWISEIDGITRFRRVDKNGQPIGQPTAVNDHSVCWVSKSNFYWVTPSVAMGPDGSFVVAFKCSGNTILAAQMFADDGTPIGTNFIVPISGFESAYGAGTNIKMNSKGDFIISLKSTTAQVMRYYSDGTPVDGKPINVRSLNIGWHIWDIDIALLDDLSFAVGWHVNFPNKGFFRKFNSAGTPIDVVEYSLENKPGCFGGNHRIFSTEQNGYLVSWNSHCQTEYLLNRIVFDSSGNIVKPTISIDAGLLGMGILSFEKKSETLLMSKGPATFRRMTIDFNWLDREETTVQHYSFPGLPIAHFRANLRPDGKVIATSSSGVWNNRALPVVIFTWVYRPVAPQTPGEMVALIKDLVENGSISNGGVGNALSMSLQNAQSSLDSGNVIAATNKLQSIINQLQALSSKKIDKTTADELIGYLENIISNL